MSLQVGELPRISLERLPLLVGRSPKCDVRLKHPTVSREHARLFLRGDRLVVADLESRYGTFVNGQRIRERALRPDDRVRFGLEVTYVVRSGALELEDFAPGNLTVEQLGIIRRGRRLVAGISAVFEPGNLVGVIGPSGLGKTLLLRALAGYYRPDEGLVRFAERDIWEDREAYLTQVGFIPQADVLYESLTLGENLLYAARVRLPETNAVAHEELVRDLLELLQLGEHVHKPAAVLSGGQRKRLSVAIELLRRPVVLLLDEPTTGLDPGNEARLVENLRQVARRNTIVIMSTHSLSGLRLFDRVLVLARCQGVGRAVFFGAPEDFVGQFSNIAGKDPADWYDILERGQFQDAASEWPSGIAKSASEGALASPALQSAPDSGEALQVFKARQHAHRAQRPGFFTQFWSTLVRCAKTTLRDRGLTAMMALQPILLAVLIVLSQYAPGKVTPILFFSSVVAVWLGMNNTVRDLVRERRQYIRDRMAGLRAESYLTAKIVLFLAIGLAQIVVFVGLLRWGCSRTIPEHLAGTLHNVNVLGWAGVLIIVYLCGMALGMVVSTVVRTEEAAIAALPILVLPQILLSAIATGDVKQKWSDARAFRPLVVTLTAGWNCLEADSRQLDTDTVPTVAKIADMLSLVCYTRPALLVLVRPPVENPVPGYSEHIWWGDLLHLWSLLLATYTAMWWLFRQYEQHWPALAGL